MIEGTLGEELSLAYPEGFHVMSEAESYEVFGGDSPERWSIWDKDRHAIISVQMHESKPGLFRKITSPFELAERAEKAARKAYADGGYTSGSFQEREIAGEKACGFDFGYTVDDVVQIGRIDVFMKPIKRGTHCYTLFLHSSKANAEENLAIYEEFLASFKFE